MELESRVIKLELRVEDHADELKKLQDISEALRRSLAGIEKTLTQIKYLAIGACIVVMIQSLGLKETIKILL